MILSCCQLSYSLRFNSRKDEVNSDAYFFIAFQSALANCSTSLAFLNLGLMSESMTAMPSWSDIPGTTVTFLTSDGLLVR